MNKKKLTVYDLLKLKGKRQIHDVYVNNVEEAIATILRSCTFEHLQKQFVIPSRRSELLRKCPLFQRTCNPPNPKTHAVHPDGTVQKPEFLRQHCTTTLGVPPLCEKLNQWTII